MNIHCTDTHRAKESTEVNANSLTKAESIGSKERKRSCVATKNLCIYKLEIPICKANSTIIMYSVLKRKIMYRATIKN